MEASTVSETGFGPIVVGMTPQEARTAAGDRLQLPERLGAEGCDYAAVPGLEGLTVHDREWLVSFGWMSARAVSGLSREARSAIPRLAFRALPGPRHRITSRYTEGHYLTSLLVTRQAVPCNSSSRPTGHTSPGFEAACSRRWPTSRDADDRRGGKATGRSRLAARISVITSIHREMKGLGNPSRAAAVSRFFKTAPGQYGAGDRFLGISVPVVRKLSASYQAPVPSRARSAAEVPLARGTPARPAHPRAAILQGRTRPSRGRSTAST